jgi:cobalt/nickel transport system permease protein
MFAMHAPDGFLEPPVAAVTAVLSAVILMFALRQSRRELKDKQLPLAGITAAFIFAAQMFNFPVASGTTGHLLGGALAAILLGPATGSLVVAIVVIVQALLFADGGLSALGYNVMNMAIVPAFGGYALFLVFRRIMPTNSGGIVGATGLAAAFSVVLSAMAFSIEWLFGASAPVPFDNVFTAMVGVHLLIGIGEGVISALAMAAVLASRPDLVYGIRDLDQEAFAERTRVSTRAFVIGGVLTAALVAIVVSQFAADDPDGLEKVSIEEGFASEATDHALDSSIFADYATSGVDNETLSLAIAGLCGTVITLAVGYGVFRAVRGTRREQPEDEPAVA